MSKCQLLPWLKANHRHHTHYTHGKWYGPPYRMGWDILRLSPFAHWLIHGIAGGTLTMNRSVTRQNAMAERLPLPWLWRYPNPVQRVLHWVARMR
jgi:hypothetical protein